MTSVSPLCRAAAARAIAKSQSSLDRSGCGDDDVFLVSESQASLSRSVILNRRQSEDNRSVSSEKGRYFRFEIKFSTHMAQACIKSHFLCFSLIALIFCFQTANWESFYARSSCQEFRTKINPTEVGTVLLKLSLFFLNFSHDARVGSHTQRQSYGSLRGVESQRPLSSDTDEGYGSFHFWQAVTLGIGLHLLLAVCF